MNRFDQTGVRRSAVGLLWLAFGSVAPLAAADDLTAEVVKQARARQEKVKSLDVKLKHTEVLWPGAVAKGNKAFPPTPPKHTVLSSESRLVIHGNKLRYEEATHTWRSDNTARQFPRIVVSDDAGWTTFFPAGIGNNEQG